MLPCYASPIIGSKPRCRKGRWFILGNDVAGAADDVDVDTMEPPLSRRLWDPGVRSTSCCFNVVDTMTTTMAARNESMAWHPPASTLLSSSSVIRLMAHLVIRHGRSKRLVDRSSPWGYASIQSLFQCSHPVLSRPTVPNMSPIEFLSLIAWLFRPVSLFHCCHPVLSRPAVPNVDS